jgi:hypothetical protein
VSVEIQYSTAKITMAKPPFQINGYDQWGGVTAAGVSRELVFIQLLSLSHEEEVF